MSDILLRARKDPFDVVTPEETLARNLIAENAGNLIFSTAAYKILATAETRITADRFVIDPGAADRINERYDAYVIPLANAFRISFEPVLIRMTQLIRRLRIPVVVLGVGAQTDIHNDPVRLERINGSVRDFVAAVLDRSPTIGVRGELTQDYLQRLGFRDVEVIGCPSMFIHGTNLQVTKRLQTLDRDARLAINVSPYVKAMGPVVRHHVEHYPNLLYLAQDLPTLERLLWGDSGDPVAPDDPRPIHLAHPLYRDDKVRFFVDPWPWFDQLAAMDFSFGTRIHGNIAALIAGTPSFVLAHDSRTLELVRYHDIPHRLMVDMTDETDAAELYETADYGPLHDGHPGRLARFVAYLDRHGLDHIFRSPAPDPDFDTRMAATPFPPAVTVADRVAAHGVRQRARRLRSRARRMMKGGRGRRLRAAVARARRVVPGS
jgi:Polysaccharide pyruvyl transferase